MKFTEIKPKRWQELTERLDDTLKSHGIRPPSRYVRRGDTKLILADWVIPAIFDAETNELNVWNRANALTSDRLTVSELAKVETLITEWVEVMEAEAVKPIEVRSAEDYEVNLSLTARELATLVAAFGVTNRKEREGSYIISEEYMTDIIDDNDLFKMLLDIHLEMVQEGKFND